MNFPRSLKICLLTTVCRCFFGEVVVPVAAWKGVAWKKKVRRFFLPTGFEFFCVCLAKCKLEKEATSDSPQGRPFLLIPTESDFSVLI